MNIDILGECTTYEVDLLKVPDFMRETIMKNLGIDCDNLIPRLSAETIALYHIPQEAVCQESKELDEDDLELKLYDYLNRMSYFLVCASVSIWNGLPGYYFCTNILKTVERPIDTKIYITEATDGAIKCREIPYNVSSGVDTYIIGLTESDYNRLLCEDYDVIEQFAVDQFK